MTLTPYLSSTFQIATPHMCADEISYIHRFELMDIFKPHLNTLHLDHISIVIFNPAMEFMVFTTTPSLVFSLFHEDLWRFDGMLSPTFFTRLKQFEWPAVFDRSRHTQLHQLKFKRYGLHYGKTLVRTVDDFHILYAFGTASTEPSIASYYKKHLDVLYAIGDKCYQAIRPLYSLYYPKQPAPALALASEMLHPGTLALSHLLFDKTKAKLN